MAAPVPEIMHSSGRIFFFFPITNTFMINNHKEIYILPSHPNYILLLQGAAADACISPSCEPETMPIPVHISNNQ
jgi:hypothetical protein